MEISITSTVNFALASTHVKRRKTTNHCPLFSLPVVNKRAGLSQTKRDQERPDIQRNYGSPPQ
jgi:hypothetical protein